jgi:hypothetical protein
VRIYERDISAEAQKCLDVFGAGSMLKRHRTVTDNFPKVISDELSHFWK